MGRLRQLFTRLRRYNELSESIREHLEEKIADLTDLGMTWEQAARAARRDFGNVTRIEERSREVWQWPTVESTIADTKFALRRFRGTILPHSDSAPVHYLNRSHRLPPYMGKSGDAPDLL